jgi:hypothetical protein
MGVVLAIELADQSAQPDKHGVDHAFVDGPDFDPKKRQPLVNASEVLHVAREAIERLNDYDVEDAISRPVHQAQ